MHEYLEEKMIPKRLKIHFNPLNTTRYWKMIETYSSICYRVFEVKYFSVGPMSIAFVIPEIIFGLPVIQWKTTEVI